MYHSIIHSILDQNVLIFISLCIYEGLDLKLIISRKPSEFPSLIVGHPMQTSISDFAHLVHCIVTFQI